MKLLKYINLVIIISLIMVHPVLPAGNSPVGATAGQFEKVGSAGSQFLKIGVGARALGMGGAYGAVTDDLTSIFWNPAGIADIKDMSADFSYTQWIAGFNHSFGAFAMPLGSNFTLAAHLIRFGSQNMQITSFEDPNSGLYYTVSDICGGVTIAGYLTDKFSFGATFKYISNSFSSVNANGIAFDIGTKYETGIQGIKLGFAIMNLGTQEQYSGTSLNFTTKLNQAFDQAPIDAQYLSYPFSLPLTFRAGFSSDVYKDETNKVTAAFDFTTMTDVAEQYAVGAEYVWSDLLALRAGYLFGQTEFGFSGGIGIKYISGGINGKLDYAISPSKDFGIVNRLSVSLGLK